MNAKAADVGDLTADTPKEGGADNASPEERDGGQGIHQIQSLTLQPQIMPDGSGRWHNVRNLIAFWIFGLCNNFAYVVMLSAAADILQKQPDNKNETTINSTTTGNHSKLVPDCNPIGTGAILLADILPTLIIKLTAPWYMQAIHYHIRLAIVVIFAAASFPVVAFSHAVWLSLTGVVFASISAGFGEITFLSLSTHFDKNTVSTWSSGTGAAGVFGALVYAGLTAIGLSPRNTLLILLIVPTALAISYVFLLVKPVEIRVDLKEEDEQPILHEESTPAIKTDDLSILEKLKLLKPLVKFMVPLMAVYIAEYFINQALFELIYFDHTWLPKIQQYRWYQVIYQIGVFISRSSVNLVPIRHIWITSVLQYANVAVLLCQVFFKFIPNIWIVFVIILFEGLLGGAAYVNTFYRISKEIPEEHREFSMGVTSVSDSAGITIAGFVSIPVHNFICSL